MLYADGRDGVLETPSQQQQQETLPGFVGFDFWRDSGDDMLLMDPLGTFLNGQALPGQGLSLGLGMGDSSGIQIPPADSSDPVLGLASFMGPNPVINGSSMIIPPGGFDSFGYKRGIPESRYLKAAQQLLDEIVNVLKASHSPPDESNDENKSKILKEGDEGDSEDDPAAKTKDPIDNSSKLSEEERWELQDKLARLIAMLDEVDMRYNQYYHRMQIVKQSFDTVAGSGASKPYTVLALRRISHQFRCLRDAITGQIQATRKTLGEEDATAGTSISRLRYIDQQIKQQRAPVQLGMMQQHAWKPQRGLPESSVSTLRAWLFEHFLHPYPKDSDKALLARQTGLTRGQVSNWFINARVRLWKPMVEEIYKEEMGGLELDLDTLSEKATVSKSDDKSRYVKQAACSAEDLVRELDTDFRNEDESNTEHDTGPVRRAVSLSPDLQQRRGGCFLLPEAKKIDMVAVGNTDSFYTTQISSAAAETGIRRQKHKPRRSTTVAQNHQPMY
ncbi:hypothetical protein MLD38_023026 [Melastoma candidum]|uniref:Uncharacterized protein n=1 Tax=Melastoma candidum TaxID=119954 RepID=A0ACB9QMD7_9MYRT|nr:hypothetical protein MLD38_023026 [Melastoma candidum]